MNRLAETLSPYLRAHADNPVDWFPWGDEAFAEAQRRGVPLFVSIGYSTCHWCHVMARESFVDPAIAEHINANFVAVKVDREEHPEVDGAFMAAASAFTQNLGWPLTVFATPEGRTFYAGTYFPPEARPSLPSFGEVLAAVSEAWTDRRGQVEESAGAVAEALAAAARRAPSAGLPTVDDLAGAAEKILAREDRVYGGFGGAPKFPVATTLGFLTTPLVRQNAPDAAAAAVRALAAMTASELHDRVDGGFFRYATQRDWTTPHYERMLIDNAQLLDVAVALDDEDTARAVAEFLLAVLRRDGGAFGAAQDSESEIDGVRNEGGYYRRDAHARSCLQPPAVDGKVLTGWNGLAIGALARAGAHYGESAWVTASVAAADRVLRVNRDAHGTLVRSSLGGVSANAAATRGDKALLAGGLFALAAATGDVRHAMTARGLLDEALADEAQSVADPVLVAQGIVPSPDHSDGDLPSDPSALALAALAAWRLGAGDRYRAAAEKVVREYGVTALGQPFAHGAMLAAASGVVLPPRQIVVVTGRNEGPLARAARKADADLITVVTPQQARAFAAAGFDLFEGKDTATRDTVYDCTAFVCRVPAHDPADLALSRA